jgi:hypothetical protein
MLNIVNKTPFETTYSVQNDLKGYGVLCVFVSASFLLTKNTWHVAREQLPSPLQDTYWDKEKPSSIRIPSQLTHNKPGTDIILNADAVAPNGKSVTHLQTGIQVGNLQASVVVFGDRHWDRGQITPPRPFHKMPITWERAFGGSFQTEDGVQSYPYNALGTGWSLPGFATEGLSLPNIEWADQLIRYPTDSPIPAGYGALGPESPLRSCFAGTYDEIWKKTRCPYVPDDFDPAFFHAAIPALRSPTFLQGNEAVRLINLTRESDVHIRLPGGRPDGAVVLGKQNVQLNFDLEAVVIDTTVDDGSATATLLEAQMFWRATALTTRSVADVKDIRVWLAR